jgi:hypothetical protein
MIRITKPARDKIDAIKANDRRFSRLNQGYLTPSASILDSPFGRIEKKALTASPNLEIGPYSIRFVSLFVTFFFDSLVREF